MSLPTEFFTPLGEAANSMHEMVREYEQAGFSREEAIQITIELIKTAMSKDQSE